MLLSMSRSRIKLHPIICCMLVLVCRLPSQASKTAAIYDELQNLSEGDLKQVQYYSNGFDLVRIVSSASERRAIGTLVTKNGQVYEIIRIKQGTPGIATSVSADRHSVSVSFEPNCALEFRANLLVNLTGPFTLVTTNSVEEFDHVGYTVAGVDYCGSRYMVVDNKARYDLRRIAFLAGRFTRKHREHRVDLTARADVLIVDLKRIQDTKKNQRTAPGRRVESQ